MEVDLLQPGAGRSAAAAAGEGALARPSRGHPRLDRGRGPDEHRTRGLHRRRGGHRSSTRGTLCAAMNRIDLVAGKLRIERSIAEDGAGAFEKDTKNHQHRTITLSSQCVA